MARDVFWAFEAKQVRCALGVRQATLESHLRRACHDAAHIPEWEASYRFGVLLAVAPERRDVDAFEQVASAQAELSFAACRFDGGELPVYAFVRRAHKGRVNRQVGTKPWVRRRRRARGGSIDEGASVG